MKAGVRMAEHKPSSLLSQEENDLIFSLLGNRCQTLVTTVIELYTTGGRQSDEWHLRYTGVLCLVKDNGRRSYFFRLFCPLRKMLLWEHEVYNNMEYLAPTRFLHTFEAEDCITGFNFAHEDEGAILREVLLEKLEFKRQKRMERKSRNLNDLTTSHRPPPQINGLGNPPSAFPQPPTSKSRQKKRLTKADIGTPQDFRHLAHVGWDPNKGFDFENINNPNLREFFVKAGVSESQLRDPETREFIYDFIIRNGGMNAVEGDLKPPQVPTRNRPLPPPPKAPPALPSHSPAPPVPPPPPIRTLPPRNPPSESSTSSSSSTMVSVESIPSPPPPPPPMSAIPPPPMYPSEPPPVAEDPRSALLQAIRAQPQLKPVTPTTTEKKAPDRGDLLVQIRQGVELKSVSSAPPPVKSPDNGLAGALARALERRNRAIHSDTSGSSGAEDDDDDEWED